MTRAKVTVVGAGFVGATTAQRIAEKELADVVLVDVVEGLPQGKGLDLAESSSLEQFDVSVLGTNSYTDAEDSDVVVVTAGLARKPGMSRDDLLFKNAEIVSGIVGEITRHAPRAILIMVTNPLDAMTYLGWKKSGFPPAQVIGMAGVLDSARYSYFIAQEIGVSPKDVRSMVLGGHGDSMVPVPRYSTVNGIPITQLISRERIEAINDRTRNGGAEIVTLLKTGSAFYAPSAAVAAMVEAVLLDTGRVLPCCAYLTGQYGLQDIYCGVPVKLGRDGVQKVVELELTPEESASLRKSAQDVRENVSKLAGKGLV
ncbi:MAG: malate dehydrogenase [Candidatus Omnitrophica bacterium]|nr:malate dehydrogenase [Candidatus Omnitrophota bacterium]